jgi:hypothetical protein
MKKINWINRILILKLMLLGMPGQAQTIVKDAQGNYSVQKKSASPDKKVGTFTDEKGNKWPVYESKKGRIYALRTSKSGKEYKQYLDKPIDK